MLHGIYTYVYMTNYIVHYMNNYRIYMIFYMELHVIPWNLCLFPRAGRACAAKTCASRLVAACMQGQAGDAEDLEYTALRVF
jgi:hypothetical protein